MKKVPVTLLQNKVLLRDLQRLFSIYDINYTLSILSTLFFMLNLRDA